MNLLACLVIGLFAASIVLWPLALFFGGVA